MPRRLRFGANEQKVSFVRLFSYLPLPDSRMFSATFSQFGYVGRLSPYCFHKSEGIDQYIGYLFVLRLPVYGSDLKRLVRLLQMGNGRDTLPHKHPHGSKDAECAGRSAGMTDQSLRRRDIHSSEKLCKIPASIRSLECTCAMCNNSVNLRRQNARSL